jgi:hypothetical protein
MYKIVHVMSKVCQLVFAYVFDGSYPMDCNLLCESFYCLANPFEPVYKWLRVRLVHFWGHNLVTILW